MERAAGQKRYDAFIKAFREENPEMMKSAQFTEAQKLWNCVKADESKVQDTIAGQGTGSRRRSSWSAADMKGTCSRRR